jgi:prepilin-type N-terminal cleavage/methylation domain-containing protein
MYGKMRNKTVEKPNKVKNNKRGFTLVELAIVMGILVIVTGITVSFSVLMKEHTSEHRDEYEFLEDNSKFKNELCTWVAENDVDGSGFKVNNDVITVGETKTARFSNGRLIFADVDVLANRRTERKVEFEEIDEVKFETNGKLIKCVTFHIKESGERIESSFVFSLRCGTIEGGS